MKKPPCSRWSLWAGYECEGVDSRGQETLFVRSLTNQQYLQYVVPRQSNLGRIWFCKEFRDFSLIRRFIREAHVTVEFCAEVTLQEAAKLRCGFPKDCYSRLSLYLKVPVHPKSLRPTDTVMVGPAFADTAFRISDGIQTDRHEYVNDTRII